MKKIIEIKIETMSYDDNTLTLETKNQIYKIKDKRAICILADRLTTLKKQIQKEETTP
jgi:hypothetical protein